MKITSGRTAVIDTGPFRNSLVRRRERHGLELLLPGGLRGGVGLDDASNGADQCLTFCAWPDAEVLVAQRTPCIIKVATRATLPVPLKVLKASVNWRKSESLAWGGMCDDRAQLRKLCSLLLPLTLSLQPLCHEVRWCPLLPFPLCPEREVPQVPPCCSSRHGRRVGADRQGTTRRGVLQRPKKRYGEENNTANGDKQSRNALR